MCPSEKHLLAEPKGQRKERSALLVSRWVGMEVALLALASLNLLSVQERKAPRHGGAVPPAEARTTPPSPTPRSYQA